MSERELRDKYGGKLAKAINRAIRAEIPNGNEALDRLTALAGPALHSGWVDRSGKPTEEAAKYHKHQADVVDKMEAEIRKKYGIPLESLRAAQSKSSKKSSKSGKSARPSLKHKKPR